MERKQMVWDVVEALQRVHGRAESAVQAWQVAHRHEIERRREQERHRGLLRTVVRAWREEADVGGVPAQNGWRYSVASSCPVGCRLDGRAANGGHARGQREPRQS